jgi:outer membrane lipoprotein-sorting protein
MGRAPWWARRAAAAWRGLAAAVAIALACLLLAARSLPAATAEDTNPWSLFDQVRVQLEGNSPLSARFVQTFIPSGFGDGEREEGKLWISLPRCLRWDYGEPFPKSFLLCDDTAYYWNPGEPSGQRYPIENEEAPGLDFFLLTSADLRLRYNVTSERLTDGQIHIALEPIEPTDDVVRLEVVVEPENDRIVELGYEDSEGNRTWFALSDYGQGAPPGTFAPPAGVTWEDP